MSFVISCLLISAMVLGPFLSGLEAKPWVDSRSSKSSSFTFGLGPALQHSKMEWMVSWAVAAGHNWGITAWFFFLNNLYIMAWFQRGRQKSESEQYYCNKFLLNFNFSTSVFSSWRILLLVKSYLNVPNPGPRTPLSSLPPITLEKLRL